MLLWVLILSIFGALVALVRGATCRHGSRPTCSACSPWVATAFYLFILVTSNPFLRIATVPMEGPRPQPDPAGPRPRHSPAAPLSRICRVLDLVLVCGRGPDRRAHRRRLGTVGAAVDAARMDVPHARHRHGLILGLLHARLGAAGGTGTRSRTPPSCRGCPAPRCCIQRW